MKQQIAIFSAIIAFAAAASAEMVPGLECYGSLTLVDSIECATDTTHRFREHPAGASYVTNILGVATRVMHHRSDTGCYVSWRVGEGKDVVPNDPYVLVVDYPDDAPRSVTLLNFGNGTRHGYHTGWTAGDSWSPPYVTQSLESWAIPYSGETKQVVEVMVPYKKATQYNGGSRIDVATEGFDIDFALILQKEAPDSVGLAVSAIRLYKIDSYDVARPNIPYPAGGLPRRLVTSREEMGDGDNHAAYSDDPTEFYRGRAKMIRLLGMNGCSKDLLEFGYMQNWDTFGRGWKWGYAADYWTKAVEYLGQEDIDILPLYEYHGSRGSQGIGYNKNFMPWTLEAAKYPDRKYYFSNQLTYVSNCMADLTNDETLWDLEELFRLTILNLKDKAHFRGMWLRNRGGMPMGFHPNAIKGFNKDTGRTAAGTEVTNTNIYNEGNYTGTALYNEYREWWYGKRRDLFARLQSYMNGNLPGAVLYYSNTGEEPGEFWTGWKNPPTALISDEEGYTFQGKNFNQYTGKNWRTSVGWTAGDYWSQALNADSPNWGNYEIHHDGPADDPHNYTNLAGVALCYPFNCVWTVAADHARRYRTAGDDLPFVRHYSLNENDLKDGASPPNGNNICGYYTCDWDHAGRSVMLAELYAMAYSDPTMLGYLFGSNLGRTDSVFVREFNLNFLSLPAVKGEAIRGGAWPDTLTVRKYAIAADTNYWAVINCDSKPWTGTVDFKTSKTRIWQTVGGIPLDLTGGKASVMLEPFQMVCFTDVEPEAIDTPIFRYITAPAIEARRATIRVNLADLGSGASWADVSYTVTGGTNDVIIGTMSRFNSHGAQDVVIPGLEPETPYRVSFVAVNSQGKSATMGFSFRSAAWPFAFETPVSVTDSEGTNATASVRLTRADLEGTLALVVNGVAVRTWAAPSVGVKYSASFPIRFGREMDYKFTIIDDDELYPAEVCGAVLGRKTLGWFDIAMDNAAYDTWPFASASGADPADGGAWEKDGAKNETILASDGGDRRLDLATGEDGFVRYTPASPSLDGAKALVSGRTQFISEYGVPDTLSPSPLAALALGSEGTSVTLYGWTADGWKALDGIKAYSPMWLDWSAEFDFTNSTVAYKYGDPPKALTSGGVAELPMGAARARVSKVTYIGSGAVDDFSGVYYIEGSGAPQLLAFDAAIKAGSAGLSFINSGTDTSTFRIGIGGAVPGQWYVAFASPTLVADKSRWKCVSCRLAESESVDLPADTEGRPSLFFRIFATTGEIDLDTPLSEFLEQ